MAAVAAAAAAHFVFVGIIFYPWLRVTRSCWVYNIFELKYCIYTNMMIYLAVALFDVFIPISL